MAEWEDNMRESVTPEGILTTTGGEVVEGGSWSDNWRNAWTPEGLKIVGGGGIVYRATHTPTSGSASDEIVHNLNARDLLVMVRTVTTDTTTGERISDDSVQYAILYTVIDDNTIDVGDSLSLLDTVTESGGIAVSVVVTVKAI